MISVGIDVSKGKSTVCILKPYGEIVSKPFNITHTHKDLANRDSASGGVHVSWLVCAVSTL